MNATPRRQRGATLMEALVAFLVLSLGIALVSRVHSHLRLHADVARQRAEAVRFAQQDIERFRSFAALGPVAGLRSYVALASVAQPIQPAAGDPTHTAYTLDRQVDVAAGFKTARVAVRWNDVGGQAQHTTLDTVVAGTDPALAAALALGHDDVRGAFGRSAAIPLGAVSVGSGRSALKPDDAGTLAWVFDNVTGALVSQCTVPAGVAALQLSAADLSACHAITGTVLQGSVHFTAGMAPLPLSVDLVLTRGGLAGSPGCVSEARKTVAVATVNGERLHEVAASATPAVLGAAAWRDTGERLVAYHCVVTPDRGRWSGHSSVVAQGWTIGTAAGDHRICRYSGDQDRSGTVDSNAEHPEDYVDVSGSLMQQNFLVIAGHASCPTASRLDVDAIAPVFADAGTVQHQP